MYEYNKENIHNINYTPEHHEKIETDDYKQITASGCYENMIINRVNFKKGESIKKDFRTGKEVLDEQGQKIKQPYEMVQLEFINPQEKTKVVASLNLVNSRDRVKMDELIFLTNEKGFSVQTVNLNDGRSFDVIHDFDGYTVDVVLDNFRYNGNYVNCTLLGFFKHRKSAREIFNKVEMGDLNECLSHCRNKIREELKTFNPISTPSSVPGTPKFGSPTPNIPNQNITAAPAPAPMAPRPTNNSYANAQANYQYTRNQYAQPQTTNQSNDDEIPF